MHMNTLMGTLIGLGILLLIIIFCRELFCWYWKLNRIIELLEEQNRLLRAKLGERKTDRLEER